MTIQSLTYKDIPIQQRREAASRNLARLRERIGDPTISPEQRQQLTDQVDHLEGWVAGEIRQPQPNEEE